VPGAAADNEVGDARFVAIRATELRGASGRPLDPLSVTDAVAGDGRQKTACTGREEGAARDEG